MSEMIERVARAICERHHLTWDCFGETAQKMYRDMARAAIQAMREPTDAILAELHSWSESQLGEEAWISLIDAALSETAVAAPDNAEAYDYWAPGINEAAWDE